MGVGLITRGDSAGPGIEMQVYADFLSLLILVVGGLAGVVSGWWWVAWGAWLVGVVVGVLCGM
jgi:hypothetical protein